MRLRQIKSINDKCRLSPRQVRKRSFRIFIFLFIFPFLGMALFFHTHACNDICRSLTLTEFDLFVTERASLRDYIRSQVVIVLFSFLLFDFIAFIGDHIFIEKSVIRKLPFYAIGIT